MINSIDQIVNKELYKNREDFSAICLPYDGYFEYLLGKTGVYKNLYYKPDHCLYNISYSRPSILRPFFSFSQIPDDEIIDCVIVNSREDQLQIGRTIAEMFYCDVLVFDHEFPPDDYDSGMVKFMNDEVSERSLATSEPMYNLWLGKGDILTYNIHSYYEKKETDILVVCDFGNEDRFLFESLYEIFPSAKFIGVGANPDHSNMSYEDIEREISVSSACVYLCSDTRSPIVPLMAAASGSLVVTNKTPATTKFFDNSNSILFEGTKDLESNRERVFHPDDKTIHSARRMIENYLHSWKNLNSVERSGNKVFKK